MAMWKEGMEYLKIENGQVIFCCTHDPIILNIASKIAKEKNLRVFHYIDPDDLMAIPYDIALIDKGLLKKGIWENFVAWQKDLYEHGHSDDTIYIILDKEKINRDNIHLRIKRITVAFKDDYRQLFSFIEHTLDLIGIEIPLEDFNS